MGSRRGRASAHERLSTDCEIRATEELWATRMLPEGILERWLVADDALVEAGVDVAELLVEGALVHVVAPVAGRVRRLAVANDLVEPGSLLGHVQIESKTVRDINAGI